MDSPIIAGSHFRKIRLSAGPPSVDLNIVSDSDAALLMSPEQTANYTQLVIETNKLFGAHHYTHYEFLYTLSDRLSPSGLEHHESSDDRVPERTVIDESVRKSFADLLSHEYVHSWNGKYRRPVGLATPDYQQPMRGDLLWVYEGLTEYLGSILAARSGLRTPEDQREHLAIIAAYLDRFPGRTWRPLSDAATELYVSACVLNRLDFLLRNSHDHNGALRLDLETGRYYLRTARRRIRQSLAAVWDNDDEATTVLANHVLKN